MTAAGRCGPDDAEGALTRIRALTEELRGLEHQRDIAVHDALTNGAS